MNHEHTKKIPMKLIFSLFLLTPTLTDAQELLPVSYGDSVAEVITTLGEPSERYANSVRYEGADLWGWRGSLTIVLSESGKVSGGMYDLEHSTEAAWSEWVDQASKYMGRPDQTRYIGGLNHEISREAAAEMDRYIRAAVWLREDSIIAIQHQVSPNETSNVIAIRKRQ
jgi:hypothetical protein